MSEASVRHPAAVLFAIAVSAFLATFNETFLNVALTPIMQDYAISFADVQWVSTAYMLVAAVTVPVTGFLYRDIPTRPLNIAALVLLLAGTLMGFAAVNFPMLLAARMVQALGTGMVVPIGMNLTLLVAPQGKLGTYMGIVSAVTLLGPAFGPIAGGVLLSVAGWHMLFAAFAVMTAVALAFTVAVIRNFSTLTHPKADAPSVALVSVGLVGIMYGISTAFGGNVPVVAASLIVGVACMAGFVRRQRRLEEPLLNLQPFENKGFARAICVVLFAFMTVFAMNIILPLFMQGSLGYTAMDAALTLLVPCMSCCVFAPIAGRLFDRFGLSVSLPIALAVMTVFAALLSQCTGVATSLVILSLYTPILVGCAFSVGPSQSYALGMLPAEQHADGTTICYTVIQLAGCIGSSLYVGIMDGVEQSAVAAGATAAAATGSGFSAACLAAAGICLVGFFFALATSRSARALQAQAPVSDAADFDRVMNKNAYTVPADATAYEALLEMVVRKTSGLPLVNGDGTVAGFISDGDIMRALSRGMDGTYDIASYYAQWLRKDSLADSFDKLRDTRALDLATRQVVSIERGEGLEAACRKLSDVRIKKIPVTEDGKLVGTLSRSDVVRYLTASSVKAMEAAKAQEVA
ncbi:MAG: MFS transporter [Eggerthellaceae bacterium]|jgi:DHA2 family lincomycin resistance protein-like MFS transporter